MEKEDMLKGGELSYNDFRNNVLKVSKIRSHKINNSVGVYSAYKYIRKNKWFDIGRPITEHEFYSIIRKVNEYLANNLSEGKDIKLPNRMGILEVRKYEAKITIKDNKVVTNLPIDWNRTIKLWYEDEESYKKKTLIKKEEKEIFKIFYNKSIANYNNKIFYEFKVNRNIKQRLKQNIKDRKVDAFLLNNS